MKLGAGPEPDGFGANELPYCPLDIKEGVMKKRIVAVIVAFVVAMIPYPPAYSSPTHETWYTVYVDCWSMGCQVSPCSQGILAGEWVRGCNYQWSGWGSRPGDSCTSYVSSQGDPCS